MDLLLPKNLLRESELQRDLSNKYKEKSEAEFANNKNSKKGRILACKARECEDNADMLYETYLESRELLSRIKLKEIRCVNV